MNLIKLITINDVDVMFDESRNFVDLTSLCKACDKVNEVGVYLNNPAVSKLIEEAATYSKKAVVTVEDMPTGSTHAFGSKSIALVIAMLNSNQYYMQMLDAFDHLSNDRVASANTDDEDFVNKMNTLVDIGVGTLNATGAQAIGVGEGMKAIHNKLTYMTSTLVSEINSAVRQAANKPKWAYEGITPDACVYETTLYAAFNDYVNWLASAYGMSKDSVYTLIYHHYAKLMHINLRTYKTAYNRALASFVRRKLRKNEQASMVRVAYQLGILDDLFKLAWQLSDGGQRTIPFQQYVSVDEEMHPINLTPRGKREGMRLFPQAYYVINDADAAIVNELVQDQPLMASERFKEVDPTTLGEDVVAGIQETSRQAVVN
jgi:hypothetical protein